MSISSGADRAQADGRSHRARPPRRAPRRERTKARITPGSRESGPRRAPLHGPPRSRAGAAYARRRAPASKALRAGGPPRGRRELHSLPGARAASPEIGKRRLKRRRPRRADDACPGASDPPRSRPRGPGHRLPRRRSPRPRRAARRSKRAARRSASATRRARECRGRSRSGRSPRPSTPARFSRWTRPPRRRAGRRRGSRGRQERRVARGHGQGGARGVLAQAPWSRVSTRLPMRRISSTSWVAISTTVPTG